MSLALSDRARPWWILGAASSVLGLVVLDETVVGVALPTIWPVFVLTGLATLASALVSWRMIERPAVAA